MEDDAFVSAAKNACSAGEVEVPAAAGAPAAAPAQESGGGVGGLDGFVVAGAASCLGGASGAEGASSSAAGRIGLGGLIDGGVGGGDAAARERKLMAFVKQQKLTIRKLELAAKRVPDSRASGSGGGPALAGPLGMAPAAKVARCALASLASPLHRLHGTHVAAIRRYANAPNGFSHALCVLPHCCY
jgi:hypothetical protein